MKSQMTLAKATDPIAIVRANNIAHTSEIFFPNGFWRPGRSHTH